MRKDSVSLKHTGPPEVLRHPQVRGGGAQSPRGELYDRQRLREGFLALGETVTDGASSVQLVPGAEALQPCSVLLGVPIPSLFTELSVACGATLSSRSTPVALALCFAASPQPIPVAIRVTNGLGLAAQGRLQGCVPQRMASPSRPLRETSRQLGAFLTQAPVGPTDSVREAEGNGAAVRSTPALAVLQRILCCTSRCQGSSKSLFDAPVRGFCEAQGMDAFTDVLRPEGPEASSGFRTKWRTQLFLSWPGRPARQRQVGIRLVSWR